MLIKVDHFTQLVESNYKEVTMGYTTALGYKEQAELGNISLQNALRIHLTGNHYPPHPPELVGPCLEAINAANDEEIDRIIELPEGLEYRGAYSRVSAATLIRACHLSAFIMEEG